MNFEILDKTGNVLVTSQMCFSLELYKSKIDNQALNASSAVVFWLNPLFFLHASNSSL